MMQWVYFVFLKYILSICCYYKDAVDDAILFGMSWYQREERPGWAWSTHFVLRVRIFGSSILLETSRNVNTERRGWLALFGMQELQHLWRTGRNCGFNQFLPQIWMSRLNLFSCRFTGSPSHLQCLRARIPRSLCWSACGKATQDLVVFQLCRSKKEQTRNQIQWCVFEEGSQTGWQQFFRRRYINLSFYFYLEFFFNKLLLFLQLLTMKKLRKWRRLLHRPVLRFEMLNCLKRFSRQRQR